MRHRRPALVGCLLGVLWLSHAVLIQAADDKDQILFNFEGEFMAIEATCTQHRAPLERGVIHEGRLHCPWHGVVFDVATGICSAFPTEPSAARYEVKIEGDDILLAV